MNKHLNKHLNKRFDFVARLFGLIFFFGCSSFVFAQKNIQIVTTNNDISNIATNDANASMSIASTENNKQPFNNQQIVNVNGIIMNHASNGSTSHLNIASQKSPTVDNYQNISIKGNVANVSSGRNVRSEVNIGR